MLLCKWCGKKITNKNKVIHININSNPAESYFCSKKCRNDWIYSNRKNKR